MSTKFKFALLFAAPLIAGAAGYAAAHGDGPDRNAMAQKFDANGDGQLDDAERAQRKQAFAAKRAERQQRMLEKFDANGDGQLDDAERAQMKQAFAAKRAAKLAERFAALDKDGDGKLSLDEFKAGGGELRHARHGHHGHQGRQGRHGHQGLRGAGVKR